MIATTTMWHKSLESCVQCKSIARVHHARGLCKACYMSIYSGKLAKMKKTMITEEERAEIERKRRAESDKVFEKLMDYGHRIYMGETLTEREHADRERLLRRNRELAAIENGNIGAPKEVHIKRTAYYRPEGDTKKHCRWRKIKS